jgi:hypothetical protein
LPLTTMLKVELTIETIFESLLTTGKYSVWRVVKLS